MDVGYTGALIQVKNRVKVLLNFRRLFSVIVQQNRQRCRELVPHAIQAIRYKEMF